MKEGDSDDAPLKEESFCPDMLSSALSAPGDNPTGEGPPDPRDALERLPKALGTRSPHS